MRLKIEVKACGAAAGLGAGALVVGEAKSKRSFMPELWETGAGDLAGTAAAVPKDPNPLDELVVRMCDGAGCGAAFGLVSKKPPPKLCAGVEVVEVREKLPRSANAFCCVGCAWGAGDVVLVKLRPAKSSKPPKEFDAAGLVMPVLTDPRAWCWVGCGFGADAYSDKMDCFRSGLDWPGTPEVGAALEERGGAAGASDAKKSSPSKESAGLCGFACCCGGADSVLD